MVRRSSYSRHIYRRRAGSSFELPPDIIQLVRNNNYGRNQMSTKYKKPDKVTRSYQVKATITMNYIADDEHDTVEKLMAHLTEAMNHIGKRCEVEVWQPTLNYAVPEIPAE